MTANQPIVIECASSHARALKFILDIGINQQPSAIDRIGSYTMRLVPDKQYMRVGTSGSVKLVNAIHKHQSVVKSLSLIKVDTIKDLDRSIQIKGLQVTLRVLLLSIPYPITDKASTKTLFHSCDTAVRGQDGSAGKTYLTAYNDRLVEAEAIANILPAFMEHQFGAPTKSFFHSTALLMIDEIEFGKD